jgi:predicted RNase H-like HicB family nuclease
MGKAFDTIKAGLLDAQANAVSRRYPVQLQYSDDDAGWIATFPDLPGCSAWGATEAEALNESHAAARAWLKACKAAGNPVPEAPCRL